MSEWRTSLKERLSPNSYYITQAIGTERPFTGQYWWNKDAGVYSCTCCSQRLFMSEHKYENPSGYATFWNYIVDAVAFKDDNLALPKVTNAHVDTLLKNKEPIKRCVCSNCEAHIGHVFADGPAPFGKRFQVNSASLNFIAKPWNQAPKYTYAERAEIYRRNLQRDLALKDVQAIREMEKKLGVPSFRDQLSASNKDAAQELKNTTFSIKGNAGKAPIINIESV